MNYLQEKKKALMNYVSGTTPQVEVNIKTRTVGSTNYIDVTYDGITTSYDYIYVLNTPVLVGNIIIHYNNNYGGYGWKVWACGTVDFNGQTYQAGNLIINWGYNTSVDYDFVGTQIDLTNKVFAFVSFGSSQTTFLMFYDNGTLTNRDYNYYVNKTITYNLVDVTYNITDRWKFTANTPLKFNGVTYQVGEIVDRIFYYGDYDMRIFEPI